MRMQRHPTRRTAPGEVNWGRRVREDQQNVNTVLFALIAANVVVFLLWSQAREVGWYSAFMTDNFLVSSESLLSGRIWTVLTYAFSHIGGWHLVGNMVAVYFFGRDVATALGTRALLLLYLAGGAVGGFSHVAYGMYTGDLTPALGASGSAMALAAMFGLMFPNRTILIHFFIPVPAWVLVMAYIFFAVNGMLGGGGSIAHAAHFGGLAFGLAFWATQVRR